MRSIMAGLSLAVAIVFCAPQAMAQDNVSLDEQLREAGLAPTGTLRASFLGGNPVQGRVDPDTGEVSGPIADMIEELAMRLGVPYEFLPVSGAQNVMDHINGGTADVGLLAYEDARAEQVDYAGPYALMTSSYLVAVDSPLQNSAETDSAGVVIGTVPGRSQEIFLSGNLQNAELRMFEEQPTPEEMERLLTSGEISAFAQNRQRSVDAANASPNLRGLPDSFFDVPQSFVVLKGDTRKAAAIRRFVNSLRESGFLEASLMRAGVSDSATVAPPDAVTKLLARANSQ